MTTTQFTMRLDSELKTAIEDEARRQDLSASQIATRAIRSHLDAQVARRQMIEEAITEADKGVLISGEAMTAWIESWDTDNELPVPTPDIGV
ncbi:hypothetical protein D6850_04355 [Roseovarius spongiae]|uniref:Ribbon-helix-helix protein, CopG family n=1 Tax=Roseovarius spongiae TaxID=2320272 RepID=A0A3A8AY58_9RHOB|nr:hypothetical protein [Roseovarius spongiae]RKF16776.1 hypothetical protein D6850_04355 [Roseovarius spongiae]